MADALDWRVAMVAAFVLGVAVCVALVAALPRALTLASSLEPMAFNIGIAFGTAVGGAVAAGPGIWYAGAVGAVFSIVACALVVLCLRLIRRARVRSQAA